jgi:RNA polymerase subunit RPABC4/transcription elongation factor Spt4
LTQRTCANCGTVFSDSQFCPECGQWADPLEDDLIEEFTLEDTPADYDDVSTASPASGTVTYVTCPSCGAANPTQNRHCEECGARLSQETLPVAPPPMLRTSAGARALVAAIVVIVLVVIAAFVFRAIGGEEEPAAAETTVAATSTTVRRRARQITPLTVTASSTLGEKWAPENLVDGDSTTAWNDNSLGGKDAWIEFTFAQPVEIQWINVVHYQDDERFFRNFRVRGYLITADDLRDQPMPGELEDIPGQQRIAFQSVRTTSLRLEVVSTWPAQAYNGEVPYEELAIQEIEFWGRDAQPLDTES